MMNIDDKKSKAKKELEELLVRLKLKTQEQDELIKELEQLLNRENHGKS